MGGDLMFYWVVVDQTHCILIFNHSRNELSFSQSICEGGKEEKKVKSRRKKYIYTKQGVRDNTRMDYDCCYLRNMLLSHVFETQ